jgi:hypothetical protein
VDAERRFRLGELDIGPPQRVGGPVAQIGAQHVAAFAVAGPVVPFGPHRPVEAQPGGQGRVRDQTDVIAGGGTRIAAEQATDLTLCGAAIDWLARPREPRVQARQARLDARAEARVHGLFLLLPLG